MNHQSEIGKILRLFKLYQLLPREQLHAKSVRTLLEESELTVLYSGNGIDPLSY